MVKKLITVGNSKALILPASMIEKHKLDKVVIEEVQDGILIKSATETSPYHKSLDALRKNKAAIYKRMTTQASAAETIEYYAKDANNLSNVDTDIIDE